MERSRSNQRQLAVRGLPVGISCAVSWLCLVLAFESKSALVVRAWTPLVQPGVLRGKVTSKSGLSVKFIGSYQDSCVALKASVVPTAVSGDTDINTNTVTDGVCTNTTHVSPLAMTVDELAVLVGGRGRAHAIWDYYRAGMDPLDESSKNDRSKATTTTTTRGIVEELPVLGKKAQNLFRQVFVTGIEETTARVVHQTTSADGTTKLLMQLLQDNLQVEAVIIPWPERSTSTLCVSSQVGCKQACTFCQTGRMGKLRSLTASEILAQVWAAIKTCRSNDIYPVDNVVFMGMGEPADNVDAVVQATRIMTAASGFQLAPRKVTISTVAPSPQAFEELGKAPVVLAWSVHSSRDEIRRELVPTTQHSMIELREGLLTVLQKRSKRLRGTMLEVAVIAGKNDSIEDAEHLADFCQPLLDDAAGIKVVVNLIPWNDIAAPFGPAAEYKTPSKAALAAFQKILVDRNILCYVRTTRGDDESAACGQLATQKRPATDQ